MLPLAIFAILRAIACVSMGADTPFIFSPSLTSQRIYSHVIAGGVGPIIPDINPNVNLPINGVSLPVGTDSNEFSTSTTSYPSQLSFAEWSSRVCKQGIPVVEYFAHYFMESIKSSKKLRKAFQLKDFTANTLSSLFYNVILTAHLKIGNPKGQESADLITRAVSINFYKVKKDSLIRIYAYVPAKILFYSGFLKASNASSLAQEYFSAVKRNILSIKNPTPEANIRAIGIGFDEFAVPLGVLNKYTATMGVSVLASEWYALGANKHSGF